MNKECVIVIGLICSTVVIGMCLFSEQKDYSLEFGLTGIKFVKEQEQLKNL